MFYYNELTSDQRRQMVDASQLYAAWREAEQERQRRFTGSMRWAPRSGADYLLRKIGRSEHSLGPRSPETEQAYAAFMDGRDRNKIRLETLSRRLDDMAPVNRAMRLGRVPHLAARILRRCDDKGLLGRQIFVVGTNALFAYEALAGVRIDSGLVASGDIDLMFDARRRLSLAVAEDIQVKGLIGLLQQADHSFSMPRPRAYSAVNDEGYYVDLICPEPRDVLRAPSANSLTDLPEDMEGAAVFGLSWLINAPKMEAVALDDRGYPARMVVIDPRVFALHKAWLSRRPGREAVKAGRDVVQGRVAAQLSVKLLGQSFDSPDLSAVPEELRAHLPDVRPLSGPDSENIAPAW